MKHFKLFVILLFISIAANAQQKAIPFADELQTFHTKDSLNTPPKGGSLFIGSSSVRKWDDFEQRFPNPKLIRRGIGGSTLSQYVKYYAPYVIFPYEPSKIFIYVGENDIAIGASAEQLIANYQKLAKLIKTQLPEAQLYFLSVKYSPSRAKYTDVVTKTNQLLLAYTQTSKRLHYINVTDVLLTAGKSDPSLFQSDMLHLNSKGYDRWDKVLRPYFMEQ